MKTVDSYSYNQNNIRFYSQQIVQYSYYITLDPRLPFPDWVGGIFLVQPLLKKYIRVLNAFPSWRGYND